MNVLTACLLVAYCFYCVERLVFHCTLTYAWSGRTQYLLSRILFLLLTAVIACIDIWSAAAMAALHLTSLNIVSDGLHLLLSRLFRKPGREWGNLYGSGILPMILLAGVLLYGNFNMNRVVQTDYTVLTHKSIRTEGYRVAFLSDIHYGTVQDKGVLWDCIDRINAQEPDVVILGGDIVEEGTSISDMQEVFQRLGCLNAPLGIYFVYGNHDRQADSTDRTYTDEALIAAMEENGIVALEDETLPIGGELLLIGRANAAWDRQTARMKISELIQPGQEALFLLTLDHQPLEAEENSAAGVDLMLSGHTHAGQLFPVGYLTQWMGELNYGLYQTEGCQSIVSSGFAGWGYGIRTQGHCEYVIIDILPD